MGLPYLVGYSMWKYTRLWYISGIVGYTCVYFFVRRIRYCRQYLMSGFDESNLFESGMRLPESS